MAERRSFFAELKRRNVLRAAILYVGAVWALSQGIAQLGPLFDAPNWAMRGFVIVCAIGFPFWVAFAWFYEFTPQGIKRESEVGPDESIAHQTGRKLDRWIIAVMAVAIVLLASGYLIRRNPPATNPQVLAKAASPQAVAKVAPKPFNPPADTLVVLPFKNQSGDLKQQYFSDGITEELTDALGQNHGLRVIAWATASRYRGANPDVAAIGKQLNVANLLNGSIEREGDHVRITVELVDTRNGQQLWSQHYDDRFVEIFNVQDKVSEAIASALKVKFAEADLPQGGTTNPQAHELVLKGRALLDGSSAASFAAAQQDFDRAVALDPNYADAHALLARTLLTLTEVSDLPLKATLPRIRAEAERALALDPRDADGWVALGDADSSTDPPDFAKARADYRKALAIDPSNAAAHLDYGAVLPLKEALAQDEEATLLDPADETAWGNLAVYAEDLGDWKQMVHAGETLIKIDPKAIDTAFSLAFAYRQLHQYTKMVAAFDQVEPGTPVDQQLVKAGRLTFRSLVNPALRPQALAALKVLARRQSDPHVAGNLLQLYLALDATAPALDLLESFCPGNPVFCDDLAVNPLYRALYGNPHFKALAKKYTTASAQ